MTTDLWMLVASAMLCLTIPFITLLGLSQTSNGVVWAFGNRDSALEFPAWAARARRAHANLAENLAPFAILVLVAHAAGVANETTALGATIFFWARAAHFLVYAAGIPYVRTLTFLVSLAGELVILGQLVD